jgi:hypothetical protein
VLALALSALCAPAALAADPPPGSKWTKASIPSSGGVTLHADILRQANIPDTQKT